MFGETCSAASTHSAHAGRHKKLAYGKDFDSLFSWKKMYFILRKEDFIDQLYSKGFAAALRYGTIDPESKNNPTIIG